ncbi:hypothetical protein E2C01_089522 [Portunus trituberculatus]|uniref:Uncharacterized protein n=1 Tax=Portunus trituberculatus TaxID=210409 RepID=A0A5B7JJ90_PORTR|nr:hypothetical protein [Portunus trituberculatus]
MVKRGTGGNHMRGEMSSRKARSRRNLLFVLPHIKPRGMKYVYGQKKNPSATATYMRSVSIGGRTTLGSFGGDGGLVVVAPAGWNQRLSVPRL